MNRFVRSKQLGVILIATSLVVAEIVPTSPTEDQVFRTGDQCILTWTPDSTSDGWKTMRIDLMSGNQAVLSMVTEVADSVDATTNGPTSYTWTCPPVEFDGPVYSYMFTPNDSPDLPVYSPQFTITGLDGSVDLPSTSISGALPGPSQIADPSSGQAHIGNGNPVPNASSGEELLEGVDIQLGGDDAPPSVDTDLLQPNFMSGALETNHQSPNLPVSQSRLFQSLLQDQALTTHAETALVSTSTHILGLSGTATSSASASTAHASATDASFKQVEASRGALCLAFFVLYASHTFL